MRSNEPRRSSLELLVPNLTLPSNGESVAEIPIEEIIPNRKQVRTVFNQEKIQELADSIHEHGLQSPLIVRQVNSPTVGLSRDGGGNYELVAGERRLRALKLLGRKTAPAIVREIDDGKMRILALVENVQREDLGVLEKATSVIDLKSELGNVEKVAEAIKKSRSYTFLLNRIGEMEPQYRELVAKYSLTLDGADLLASLLIDADKSQNERLEIAIKTQLVKIPLTEEFLRSLHAKYFSKQKSSLRNRQTRDAFKGKGFWKNKKQLGIEIRVPLSSARDANVRAQIIKDNRRFLESLGAKKVEITF